MMMMTLLRSHDEPQGDHNYCFQGDADDDDHIDCEDIINVYYLLFAMFKLSVTERRNNGQTPRIIEMLRRI